MTRKDYVLLANAIANAIDTMKAIATMEPIPSEEERRSKDFATVVFIANIARALENENPRFDTKRFTKACYETPATIRARREEITAQLA